MSESPSTPDALQQALAALTLDQWRTLGRTWLEKHPDLVHDLPLRENPTVWDRKEKEWRSSLRYELLQCEGEWCWDAEALQDTLAAEVATIQQVWERGQATAWEGLTRAMIFVDVVKEYHQRESEWRDFESWLSAEEVFDVMARLGTDASLTAEQRTTAAQYCKGEITGTMEWGPRAMVAAAALTNDPEDGRWLGEQIMMRLRSSESLWHNERDLLVGTLLQLADRNWLRMADIVAEWPHSWPVIQRQAQALIDQQDTQGLLDLLATYKEPIATEYQHKLLLDLLAPTVQAHGSAEQQFTLTLEQLLTSPNWSTYQAYKALHTSAAWADYREAFLELITEKRYALHAIIRRVYQEEQAWDRLFHSCQKDSDLGWLSKYGASLVTHGYRDHVLQRLYAWVDHTFRSKLKRSDYQRLAQYLRSAKAVGLTEEASALAQQLRKDYPRHRALLEELQGV